MPSSDRARPGGMTEALPGREALLDVLVRESYDAMGILDRDLRYVLVNDALGRINGLSPAEHVGRRVDEVLIGPGARAAVDAIRRVLEVGEPVELTIRGRTATRPTADRRWHARYSPFRDGRGEVVGVAAHVLEAPGPAARTAAGAPAPGRLHDELTGLGNHRAFQERLRREFREARAHGRPLSVVLLDLDRFRSVNAEGGHEAGDRLLAAVGRRLGEHARHGDFLARLGGDEFGWILPETDEVRAWQAAERAREALLDVSGSELPLLTTSAGVCDLTHAASPEDLVRFAQGALYWAKAHGRDTVLRYSPTVVRALSAEQLAERLLQEQQLASIRVLARAVDAKDTSTHLHSQRVADVASRLARVLGWSEDDALRLRDVALVHDVGKIGIPDAVLLKPGRLTPVEYDEVRRHAALGAEIVSDVLPREQVAWIRHHHERWDGEGYPERLARESIPVGARILALADAWDVMTSDRHYRQARSTSDALTECRRMAGTQFEASAVDALEAVVESLAQGERRRAGDRGRDEA